MNKKVILKNKFASGLLYRLKRFGSIIENKLLLFIAKQKQWKKLRSLSNKKQINVVFFVINETTWKYGEVYKRLLGNGRFHVTVLVCPIVNRGREYMLKEMKRSYDWFKSNNYNVLLSYNSETDEYVDAKLLLSPDIIFYSSPYRGLIDDRYYITHYLDVLTIHTPYAFNNNSDFNFCYNELLHNLVWRFYFETNEHKVYAEQSSLAKGRNVVVTGYAGIEKFINGYQPETIPWKVADLGVKRIIWAPHWTIQEKGGNVNYSCFLLYADFMIELACKYKDKAQFVLKPHPILITQLENLWGKERASDYYNQWRDMPNTSLCETAYEDLFLTSDAMIHDSGSFINEYLYVNKPALRTMKHAHSIAMYNSFTQRALDYYYKAYNKDDIEQFVINVINGIDPMKSARTKFVNDYLLPYNGSLPSENIVFDILDSIDNQVLYRN